jgi:hypothetical protein
MGSFPATHIPPTLKDSLKDSAHSQRILKESFPKFTLISIGKCRTVIRPVHYNPWFNPSGLVNPASLTQCRRRSLSSSASCGHPPQPCPPATCASSPPSRHPSSARTPVFAVPPPPRSLWLAAQLTALEHRAPPGPAPPPTRGAAALRLLPPARLSSPRQRASPRPQVLRARQPPFLSWRIPWRSSSRPAAA